MNHPPDAPGAAAPSHESTHAPNGRHDAAQQIKEAEERYRALFDRSWDAVYLHDLEGRFLDANPAALRALGYTREEIPTLNFAALLTCEQDLARAYGATQELLATGIQKGAMEYRLRRKDGVPVWFEVLGSLVLKEGRPVAIQGIARDITERRRAEQEREQLQAQLMQSQKMESVGRLAGGVAHDFNNMLGVILGHSDLALEQIEAGSPLHDSLLEIQKAAQRSADLTRQLLAFARKQTIRPRVLDLNETVASMLKMLKRLIGEDIELDWRPGAELWPVHMDPAQVDQILANLAVNARDAISGVGRLSIATENVACDPACAAVRAGLSAGDYVLLALSDTGCGMDRQTMEHLFEPFFTTKEVGKGTGLGLATVYGTVRQNGGFITVQSEPGRGTRFQIYLPRAAAPAAAAAPPDPQPAGGSETVLLVEDEEAILKLGKSMLRQRGYTVLAALTPAEALRVAREHAAPIHLLVTDVVMPEMNGKELKERLAALHPEMRVLFMSGYTADVIAHQGILDEGVAFLQKPFTVNTLTQKVRELLR